MGMEGKTLSADELVREMARGGGTAFPATGKTDIGIEVHCGGMTLRDYFAGQVVASLLSTSLDVDVVAHRAYSVADAMIRQSQGGK